MRSFLHEIHTLQQSLRACSAPVSLVARQCSSSPRTGRGMRALAAGTCTSTRALRLPRCAYDHSCNPCFAYCAALKMSNGGTAVALSCGM